MTDATPVEALTKENVEMMLMIAAASRSGEASLEYSYWHTLCESWLALHASHEALKRKHHEQFLTIEKYQDRWRKNRDDMAALKAERDALTAKPEKESTHGD